VQDKAIWHKSCHLKFSKEKLVRALRKRKREEAEESSESKRNQWHKMACLFCQKGGSLHEFKTPETDQSIRKIATELQDTELMVRMEGGDLVAMEAKYHLGCPTAIRNCYRLNINQQGKEHDRFLKRTK